LTGIESFVCDQSVKLSAQMLAKRSVFIVCFVKIRFF
jgi:hypothetical protein